MQAVTGLFLLSTMSDTLALTLFDPTGIDAETALLIARLALDDIEEVEANRKGKTRADAPPGPEERAFDLQRELFEDFLQLDEDYRFARSLDDALAADQDILTIVGDLERAAEDDHRAAMAVSRGLPMPPLSVAQRSIEDLELPAVEPPKK